jgi:hypothetical protein
MNTYATGIETGDQDQARAECVSYADRLRELGAEDIEITPATRVYSNAWLVMCRFRATEQMVAAFTAQA